MAEETEIRVSLVLEREEFEEEVSKTTKIVTKEFSKVEDGAKKATFSKESTLNIKEFAKNLKSTERQFESFGNTAKDKTQEASSQVSMFEQALKGVGVAIGALGFTKFIDDIIIGLNSISGNFRFFSSNISKLFSDFGGLFRSLGNNIFGIIEIIGTLGAGFLLLGTSLRQSNSEVLRFAGVLTTVLGAALAGVSFLVVKLITSFGEFINLIGIRGVAAFSNAAKEFAKFENSSVILNKTIENFNKITDGAIGSTESWTKEISALSEELNLSVTSLQKSAQEIVSVGSQFGLNEKQLRKLIRVSAEYAKINRKDVFQTTVNLVSALSGNAQAVQALGIKLNETAVQQFAYSKGIKENIRSLSEQEVVQLRFNKLLKQFDGIQGIAASTADTLAEQELRLANNIEKVNVQLGRGAAAIENFNLLSFILNKTLGLIPESLFTIAGFLGALGSRVLQVSGLFISFSFTIFGVVKAIRALNIILANDLAQSAFARSIPIINKSFKELLFFFGATSVQLKSVTGLAKTLGSIIRNNLILGIAKLAGVTSASVGVFAIFRGLLARVVQASLLAVTALKGLLITFAPLILVVTSVIALFKGLLFVLNEIERRTGVFKTLFALLKEVFIETRSALEPVVTVFRQLRDELLIIGDKVIGVVVQKFALLLNGIVRLAKINPFNVFNSRQLGRLDNTSRKLTKLSSDLEKVSFRFSKLPVIASRGIAGLNNSINKIDPKKLQELFKILDDSGKTDFDRLQEERTQRLDLLQGALEQELITKQEFKNRELQVEQDFLDKKEELEKREVDGTKNKAKQLAQIIRSGVVNLIGGALQRLGASLVQGGKAFENFGGFILGVLGDIAIQIGAFLIKAGIGIDALKASLVGFGGGAAIAAGVGLVVLGGALKALAGSLGGTASSSLASAGATGVGGAGGGPVTTDSEFFEPVADQDEREAQQQVVVNIEGNVLDSSGSGLELVRIINEAFEKDGVVINQGIA